MAKNKAKSHFKKYFFRVILKHFWPFWTKVALSGQKKIFGQDDPLKDEVSLLGQKFFRICVLLSRLQCSLKFMLPSLIFSD